MGYVREGTIPELADDAQQSNEISRIAELKSIYIIL